MFPLFVNFSQRFLIAVAHLNYRRARAGVSSLRQEAGGGDGVRRKWGWRRRRRRRIRRREMRKVAGSTPTRHLICIEAARPKCKVAAAETQLLRCPLAYLRWWRERREGNKGALFTVVNYDTLGALLWWGRKISSLSLSLFPHFPDRFAPRARHIYRTNFDSTGSVQEGLHFLFYFFFAFEGAVNAESLKTLPSNILILKKKKKKCKKNEWINE